MKKGEQERKNKVPPTLALTEAIKDVRVCLERTLS